MSICSGGAEGEEMSRVKGRTWTEEDIRRLKLLAEEKVSADSIAKSLERSTASVIHKARDLKLFSTRRPKAKGK